MLRELKLQSSSSILPLSARNFKVKKLNIFPSKTDKKLWTKQLQGIFRTTIVKKFPNSQGKCLM